VSPLVDPGLEVENSRGQFVASWASRLRTRITRKLYVVKGTTFRLVERQAYPYAERQFPEFHSDGRFGSCGPA
jgi:hypothetical protein